MSFSRQSLNFLLGTAATVLLALACLLCALMLLILSFEDSGVTWKIFLSGLKTLFSSRMLSPASELSTAAFPLQPLLILCSRRAATRWEEPQETSCSVSGEGDAHGGRQCCPQLPSWWVCSGSQRKTQHLCQAPQGNRLQ